MHPYALPASSKGPSFFERDQSRRDDERRLAIPACDALGVDFLRVERHAPANIGQLRRPRNVQHRKLHARVVELRLALDVQRRLFRRVPGQVGLNVHRPAGRIRVPGRKRRRRQKVADFRSELDSRQPHVGLDLVVQAGIMNLGANLSQDAVRHADLRPPRALIHAPGAEVALDAGELHVGDAFLRPAAADLNFAADDVHPRHRPARRLRQMEPAQERPAARLVQLEVDLRMLDLDLPSHEGTAQQRAPPWKQRDLFNLRDRLRGPGAGVLDADSLHDDAALQRKLRLGDGDAALDHLGELRFGHDAQARRGEVDVPRDGDADREDDQSPDHPAGPPETALTDFVRHWLISPERGRFAAARPGPTPRLMQPRGSQKALRACDI